jgi:hypothetical protein
MRDKKQRKSSKAPIPQTLHPSVREGEAESLTPSPKLGRGLGRGPFHVSPKSQKHSALPYY